MIFSFTLTSNRARVLLDCAGLVLTIVSSLLNRFCDAGLVVSEAVRLALTVIPVRNGHGALIILAAPLLPYIRLTKKPETFEEFRARSDSSA
ncbi:MAG: hypothetical protein RM049_10925 [Nostoc sp. DedQUE04]|uniref:hypothetical protein n=1 Tax=Nostoc sp. DedQUE04 TaxID=3075390 RepID=UPI002AD2FB64|nr:hypothetical protein [Nostoc sp. DedQUE04]MDZ8135799.1 hypothetical protein [Nostoc sp. DedQUE04]